MCKPSTDREGYLEDTGGKQDRVPAMRSNAQADSACFALLAAELDAFFFSLPFRAASTRTNQAKILQHPRAVFVLHLPSLSTVAQHEGAHKRSLWAAADFSSAGHDEPYLELSLCC